MRLTTLAPRFLARAGTAAFLISISVAVPAATAGQHNLLDVPYLSQTEDLCGGAAVAMVLRYWGERQVYAEDFASLVDHAASGIRTDTLTAAVKRRGWQTLTFSTASRANDEAIARQLERGRPMIALIEDHPGTYHYVVVVGWTGDHVIVHDPARAAFRVLSRADFERTWKPAGHWALLVLPPDGERQDAPSVAAASSTAEPSPVIDQCGGLVQASVRLARAGDASGAEKGLLAASDLCPRNPAPWQELAGLRFTQSRWREASRFAERATELDPDDAHAWELLATTRFLDDDLDAALDAWNHIRQPHTGAVHIDGTIRTRSPVVAGMLDLPPRELLTSERFGRARHRLRELPVAEFTRVQYRPADVGLAEIDAVVAEQPTIPRGLLPIAAVAGQALVLRDLEIDVAGPTGGGEVWSGEWRWWAARPLVAFRLAIPSPGHLPGVASLEGSWERQTYATTDPAAANSPDGLRQENRRHAALNFADWATSRLRWEAGGGLDRWSIGDSVAFNAALDARLARDRLSLRVATASWVPLGPSGRFVTADVTSAWKSARDGVVPHWTAIAGLSDASAAAPLDLWPGAGTGDARAPLLRAHPLLSDGIVTGQVFGRRLAYGSVEYQRPLKLDLPIGKLGIAAFADAAKAWHRIDDDSASPIHVDVGTGLRVAVPGIRDTIRIDVARGLRDGRVVLSTGWQHQWPKP